MFEVIAYTMQKHEHESGEMIEMETAQTVTETQDRATAEQIAERVSTHPRVVRVEIAQYDPADQTPPTFTHFS